MSHWKEVVVAAVAVAAESCVSTVLTVNRDVGCCWDCRLVPNGMVLVQADADLACTLAGELTLARNAAAAVFVAVAVHAIGSCIYQLSLLNWFDTDLAWEVLA